MASHRVLTAYLTLAALLFGNAAGWVHVGCWSDSAGCCHTASLELDQGHEPRGQSCCHHDHGGTHQTQADDRESDSKKPAEQEDSDGHDSDSCSICQGFYSSRDAAMSFDTPACGDLVTQCGELALVDDAFVRDQFASSQSVRGPPRVS